MLTELPHLGAQGLVLFPQNYGLVGPSDFWHNPVPFGEKEHLFLSILMRLASQDLLPPPFLGSSCCRPPRKERPLSRAILVSGVGIRRTKVTMVC